MLYFMSSRPGGAGNGDIWQASIGPAVDFSGGKADRFDIGLLMLRRTTDKRLYDIGPTSFGDGIVDSKKVYEKLVFVR